MITIDTNIVDNIPLGRSASALIESMPGVQESADLAPRGAGFGGQRFTGAGPGRAFFSIDGAAAMDIVYGHLAFGIPIDMIEEIQVTTGGIPAEFGQASSGGFQRRDQVRRERALGLVQLLLPGRGFGVGQPHARARGGTRGKSERTQGPGDRRNFWGTDQARYYLVLRQYPSAEPGGSNYPFSPPSHKLAVRHRASSRSPGRWATAS